MIKDSERELQIGDRVELCDSSIYMSGVITKKLGEDYLRVRWDDSTVPTTHHRRSLGFKFRANYLEPLVCV